MTRKKQNTRRSLQHSIHKIYDAGMFVFAGFIVGFDSEQDRMAEAMIRCIEDTAIPVCTVGLLYALPGTQLGRRLTAEGRLFPGSDQACPPDMGEQCTAGLNFVTQRPRRDVLSDYRQVLATVYDPAAYFGRVRRMTRRLRRGKRRYRAPLRHALRDVRAFARLLLQMATTVRARREFFRAALDCALHNPRALPFLMMLSALYLHLGPYARLVVGQIDQQIDDIEEGRWIAPESVSGETKVLSVA
jgi:hypothetical protein